MVMGALEPNLGTTTLDQLTIALNLWPFVKCYDKTFHCGCWTPPVVCAVTSTFYSLHELDRLAQSWQRLAVG